MRHVMQKAILIVDGYKFSKDFALAVKSQGYACLHLYSNTPYPFLEKSSTYDPSDYLDSYCYAGDLPALKEWINQFDIVLAIPATDLGVRMEGMINELCETQSDIHSLSDARRDKFLMLEACAAHGVKVPLHIEVDEVSDVCHWLEENDINYPIVVKPRAQAGSFGVSIVHDLQQLTDVVDSLKKTKSEFTGQAIKMFAEEFLEGVEFVVNTVSCQGKHHVTDFWRYSKTQSKEGHVCYDRGELLNTPFEEQESLEEYCYQCLDALGIRFGASHTEIMMTASGPRLVEVNARISGSYDRTIWMRCLGYDLIQLCVENYVKKELTLPKLSPSFKKEHALMFMPQNDKAGIVEQLPDDAVIQSLPSYYKHYFQYKIGDRIVPTTDIINPPGKIILLHPDPAVLKADYDFVKAYCKKEFKVSALPEG